MLLPLRLATVFAALAALLPAQNLLVDGDLEMHSASGCTYNRSITQFNALYPFVHSFGISSGVDVMQGSCMGLPVRSGTTKLGLAWNNAPNGNRDAISIDLSVPLVQGLFYDLSFALEALPFGAPRFIDVGVSTSPGAFGNLVAMAVPPASGWQDFATTFVAPMAATHLTVSISPGTDTWTGVDNFVLRLATQASNTVYGQGCGGLQIQGLNRPVLGTTWDIGVSQVQPSATICLVALDFVNSNTPLGPAAPGCTLYSGGLWLSFLPVPVPTPAVRLPLPLLQRLAGTHLYGQAGTLFVPINPLGISASNALDGLTGTY